jgi:hypothetical protein
MAFINRHYLSDKTVTAHKAQTTSQELLVYLRRVLQSTYIAKSWRLGRGRGREEVSEETEKKHPKLSNKFLMVQCK